MRASPAFLHLRRIEAARDIATMLGRSRNRIYLEADTLLMNLTSPLDGNLERGTGAAATGADKGEQQQSK